MSDHTKPRSLLELSRELKSIAEAGLRYSEGPFDLERYQRLHELASEILHADNPDFHWTREFGYATPKVDVRGALIERYGARRSFPWVAVGAVVAVAWRLAPW